MQKKGNKYGTHRVIEPKGVLTQAAYKIDNNMDEIYSNEILCNVTALNVDSASFTQIADVCGHDDQKIGEMILSIVAERGKQQNPVTGSGGMFMGTVAKIGDDLKGKIDLKEGDRITHTIDCDNTAEVLFVTDRCQMYKARVRDFDPVKASALERRAEEAERETDKLKKVEYMSRHLGEEFDGVISGVTNWGFYVELPNTVEGLVRVNELRDDYYVFDEERYQLIGETSRRTYKLGQSIRIQVLACDRLLKTIDFIPAKKFDGE